MVLTKRGGRHSSGSISHEYAGNDFRLIRALQWSDVFGMWKELERDSSFIQAMWKDRGYDSWDEWRLEYARPLKLETLRWDLFEIAEPMESVPRFYGGPFKSWVKFVYGNYVHPTMNDICKSEYITKNDKIHDLIAHFPEKTALIAVNVNGRITIIEGMHRCSAIALAKRNGDMIKSKIVIALAQHPDHELPMVGRQIKKIIKTLTE